MQPITTTPLPTAPEEIPDTVNRECGDCGQLVACETVIVSGRDLTAGLPVRCQDCQDRIEEAERKLEEQKEIGRRKDEWERVVAKRYRETDPAHPEFNSELWAAVRNHKPADKWLGIVGPTGKCKTRALALILKRHIGAGRAAEWCTANRFQWAAQREFDDTEGAEARRWLRKWKATPLLIFDDLGKQKWTDTVESHFFDLIETRMAHDRPLWWTANTDPHDMIAQGQLTKDRGAPIIGRLLEASHIIDLY